MITKMSLEYFKSFKKMDDLKIKPLTIIVGRNSCGKSSIIQSLLLLKQTLESHDDTALCLDGNYLKYINLQELSFGLPNIKKSEIFYKFNLKGRNNISGNINMKFKNRMKKDNYVPSLEIYNINSQENDSKNLSLIPIDNSYFNDKIKWEMGDMRNKYISEVSSKIIFHKFIPKHIEISYQYEDNKNIIQYRTIHVPLSSCFTSEFHVGDLLNLTINNIKYLSPVRAKPQRDYIHYSQDISELAVDGFNSAHLLWNKKDQIVSWKGKEIKLSEAVNQCIACVGLSQEITPDKVGDIIYKVGVAEKNSGKPVSLADVGFGYSQIIPIILLGLLNNSENLMLIEQPEIHLHPSSAANLADLFLGFIEDDKRFMIETHSQDFINKLRLRVIQNPALKDKINIVFVEQDSQGESHIKQFEIDENGMFPEWPEGFIDESENLAREILNARLNRT